MKHRPHSRSETTRLGRWLPTGHSSLKRWLESTVDAAEKKKKAFHPVIDELQRLIEGDPLLLMYFTQMFEEQSVFKANSESGDIKLKNYRQMLVVLNHILTMAPDFDSTDMVGCPINAILDFPMNTTAGLAAFASDKLNQMLKRVLNVWKEFLDSKASRYVLNRSADGWLSAKARKALNLDEIQTKSGKPYLGFKSWNDFFIRRFKPGCRPVAEPENSKAIVSPCEATPFAIETNVKLTSEFWVKSQPYSLSQLLHGNFVMQFAGGTVYQAFLSAENYHRWHSPISGTIKKLEKVDGTYFSEAMSESFDPATPINSQGYLAHVATRALLFIEADDPDIGLLCVIFVGMVEVSSCEFIDADGHTLEVGQKLTKGDQVGYFQFGGSTFCLVCRPGVISQFAANAIPQGENGSHSTIVKVNTLLAMAH